MRHLQRAAPQTAPAPSSKAGTAVTADAVADRLCGAARNDDAISRAAVGTTHGATAAGGSESVQRTFVNRMWDHALVAQRATGAAGEVHRRPGRARIRLGPQRDQRAPMALRSYNLFGIKATGGWQGRTVEVPTTEYENGIAVRKVEKFRAYNNYAEAFRDWSRLLHGEPALRRGAGAGSRCGRLRQRPAARRLCDRSELRRQAAAGDRNRTGVAPRWAERG